MCVQPFSVDNRTSVGITRTRLPKLLSANLFYSGRFLVSHTAVYSRWVTPDDRRSDGGVTVLHSLQQPLWGCKAVPALLLPMFLQGLFVTRSGGSQGAMVSIRKVAGPDRHSLQAIVKFNQVSCHLSPCRCCKPHQSLSLIAVSGIVATVFTMQLVSFPQLLPHKVSSIEPF